MRAFFIIDNGNGTVRTETENSWNTPNNKPNQLKRYDLDNDVLPIVPDAKYLAWNGSEIVEASQAVQDAITGAEDAQEQAVQEAESPSGALANWNQREKCLLLVCYKLAQQHWPQMTKAQFLVNVRAEWDAAK